MTLRHYDEQIIVCADAYVIIFSINVMSLANKVFLVVDVRGDVMFRVRLQVFVIYLLIMLKWNLISHLFKSFVFSNNILIN